MADRAVRERRWFLDQPVKALLDLTKHFAVSSRKARLTACALIRSSLHKEDLAIYTEALALAETHADSQADPYKRAMLRVALGKLDSRLLLENLSYLCRLVLSNEPFSLRNLIQTTKVCGIMQLRRAKGILPVSAWRKRMGQSRIIRSAVQREVLGNIYRPVQLAPGLLPWRDRPLVYALARQMYDSRDFADLPMLADMMEDDGCQEEEILQHCRQTAHPHYKGCWVVDALLGR
jgi:hypothetical protein